MKKIANNIGVFLLAVTVIVLVRKVSEDSVDQCHHPAVANTPLVSPSTAMFSMETILQAIMIVESGGDDYAVGAAGERGAYQIMEATWGDWSDKPHLAAHDRANSEEVARKYLNWLADTIEGWSGQPATIGQVIAAYNGGIGRLRSVGYDIHAMPLSTKHYTRKVLIELEAIAIP